MALSNAERQKRYRAKAKQEELVRIDARMHIEKAAKLHYLADHWGCTKTQALERALMETWEREGAPIPGYHPEEEG